MQQPYAKQLLDDWDGIRQGETGCDVVVG
jgi:hypothetical protein